MTAIFGFIAVLAIIVAVICANSKIKVDSETQIINQNIAALNKKLKEETVEAQRNIQQLNSKTNTLNATISTLNYQKKNLDSVIHVKQEQLENLQSNAKASLENQKDLSKQAFQNWWDLLEKSYQEKEVEYQELIANLESAYAAKQLKLLAEADGMRNELTKIRSTRDAAIAAQRKEKEIKDKLSFYCLSADKNDLEDIQRLERTKLDLHNPRVLSMLIWQTYWQKPMTALCNNVLGTGSVTGIYKITNQLTGECYVGQAVEMSRRWKDHAKHGLGIDTPANNKLYKAMQKDGIWNFSWEMLEQCSPAELNEKEKFYIDLYQSYDYGYNNNAGIGR